MDEAPIKITCKAMDAQELFKKQNEIEKIIYSIGDRISRNGLSAMPDGVSNPALYLSQVPKIAWIGKEPYDEDEVGGWSLTEGFRTNTKWATRTWQRVIYVMYSLINNSPYRDLGYIRDYPEMGDVMQSIAWINLSKMPGGRTSSNRKYIKEYQDYWRPIVQEQLRLYNPDVIIFCNTLDACFSDFFPEGKNVDDCVCYNDKECFIEVYKRDSQLLLNAFHPGKPMSSKKEEFYVDSLVETIRRYFLG